MNDDDLMNWMASGYYTPDPNDLKIDWEVVNKLLGPSDTGSAETDREGEGSA